MIRYFILIILLLVIFFSLVGFLRGPQSGLSAKKLLVGSNTLEVEIAANMLQQIRGLSDRSYLCPDCGMLFVYKRAEPVTFWMKGMKFPLDMIFIRSGRVVEIVPNVPIPVGKTTIPTVRSQEAADQVLEVNAGFVNLHGIMIGDRVRLQ